VTPTLPESCSHSWVLLLLLLLLRPSTTTFSPSVAVLIVAHVGLHAIAVALLVHSPA
jgi:hypothetical protein